MRKFMILLLSLGALAACSSEKAPDTPKEKEKVKLDPYAKLYVNCQATKADENGLETADYIVRNCAFIGSKMVPDDAGNISSGLGAIGLTEHTYNTRRDLVNSRFVFDGGYAVYEDGTPGHLFGLENVVFTIAKFDGIRVFPTDIRTIKGLQQDTVAYIPNAVMDEIRAGITKAIEEGDYEKCHRILNESFVFIPIKDGAEWRKIENKR